MNSKANNVRQIGKLCAIFSRRFFLSLSLLIPIYITLLLFTVNTATIYRIIIIVIKYSTCTEVDSNTVLSLDSVLWLKNKSTQQWLLIQWNRCTLCCFPHNFSFNLLLWLWLRAKVNTIWRWDKQKKDLSKSLGIVFGTSSRLLEIWKKSKFNISCSLNLKWFLVWPIRFVSFV